MPNQNDYISPSTRWQALIGTLPFLAFGLAIMETKAELLFRHRPFDSLLLFFVLILAGLCVGWIYRFPLWSYSYLGWSLVFAWWWTNMRIYGFDWGYLIWVPFGITVLIALWWTRSIEPIKKLFPIFGTIGPVYHWRCSPSAPGCF